MSVPNKRALLKALVEHLSAEFERAKAQALDAAAGATHEDNRAEGDKDMRSTEASYVARGHAQRTAQLEEAIARLSHLESMDFGPGASIESTALVELTQGKQRLFYFILPVAGGERLRVGDVTVQSLTPTSPLGSALLGLSAGDEAEVESPQGVRVYAVVSVR